MGLDNIPKRPPQEEEGKEGAERWMEEMDKKARDLASSDWSLREYKRYLEASEKGDPYPHDLEDWGMLNMYKEARDNGITPEMWLERQSKARSEEARMQTFWESLEGMSVLDLRRQLDGIEKELKTIDPRFVEVRGETRSGGGEIRIANIWVNYPEHKDWFVTAHEEDYDTYRRASELVRKRHAVIEAFKRASASDMIKSSKEDWEARKAA